MLSISQDTNVNFCVGAHQAYGKIMTAEDSGLSRQKKGGVSLSVDFAVTARDNKSERESTVWKGRREQQGELDTTKGHEGKWYRVKECEAETVRDKKGSEDE